MKIGMNLKFLNGFGSLMGGMGLRLIKFFPVYIIIFIAYGDKFLPRPLNQWSYNTRTSINSVLVGSFNKDILKNNKYNNKKADELIKEIENKGKSE